MSPIGRVFIVLNLALAGGFVAFAGTHLQQQHNFKSLLEEEQQARKDDNQNSQREIDRLTGDTLMLSSAKSSIETELTATKNSLDQSNDENKRLTQQLASMEGDIKSLAASAQANNTLAQAARTQADAAYKMAIEDQNDKDEAIRAKDTAEAENRTLNNTIASLNDTIATKSLSIDALEKERNELNLLVSVASENGFIIGLAAPTLSGTVAHVANQRLCTIKITDNPGNVDIQDQLNKRKFGFAIYDASGYKGEAIATAYHAADNAVTCRLIPHRGVIKMGDKASTKTP